MPGVGSDLDDNVVVEVCTPVRREDRRAPYRQQVAVAVVERTNRNNVTAFAFVNLTWVGGQHRYWVGRARVGKTENKKLQRFILFSCYDMSK